MLFMVVNMKHTKLNDFGGESSAAGKSLLRWMSFNAPINAFPDDEDDNPPVVQELPYDGDRTFVDGFTVNTEAHGDAWKHFRITTNSDIIDVIAAELPVMSWS